MRILILGAGGIGGYFGGRLAQAGADVTFLVRERRAAQLAERDLVVKSPFGDFTRPVRTVLSAAAGGPYDLVLLTCKAYDLPAAIDAIAPAVAGQTTVLPVLNGIAHMERWMPVSDASGYSAVCATSRSRSRRRARSNTSTSCTRLRWANASGESHPGAGSSRSSWSAPPPCAG